MSDSHGNDPSHDLQELRTKAEMLQRMGFAPASQGHVLSADALSILYRLAGSSESNSDSLKILHEFQTHQIELDLLQEQHEANALAATEELSRYRMLYEYAPIGYLVISRNGRIVESNRAAAALLGAMPGKMADKPFEDFLAPGSRAVLSWQLQKLFNFSSGGETCILQADSSQARSLRLLASHAPNEEVALVIVTDLERTTPT